MQFQYYLLEFLIEDEAQKVYAEVNYEYPIRKNITLSNFMKEYSNFNKNNIEITKVGELNKKALLMMEIRLKSEFGLEVERY